MFVLKWLSVQLQSLKNSFKENKKDFIFRDLWHTLIILVGLSLVYCFLIAMFNFIVKKGFAPFDFAFVLLSFSLLVFLPLVFYSALITILSFLFQNDDIYFYFSLPVNKLSVFTVKLLQSYFHTSWMVFLGLLTFLFALQRYFHVTPFIYLAGSIAVLVFLLIPVCLAAILVIIVSSFLPFLRAKGILTVIGLLTGSVLVALIRIMQPEQLVTAEGKMRLVSFVQDLHKPWMTFFPSEWVTNILFAVVKKDISGLAVNFVTLFLSALVLLVCAYVLAAVFYKRLWAEAVTVSPAIGKGFTWEALLKIFPSSVRAFVRKDLLSFYRDTIEKGSLLILIPLSFVYLYSIFLLYRHMQKVSQEEMFSFIFIYLFNFFYSSVVIAGLSGRWIFPSIASEGNNFKLIKGSATTLKDFIKAKFLLGFIPLLALGEFLALTSALILHFKFAFISVSLFTTAFLCTGISLICISQGTKHADFSVRSPLSFALSIKGFMCLVWEMVFVGITVILVGVPSAIFLYKGYGGQFLFASALSLFFIFLILKYLVVFLNRCLTGLAKMQV